MFSDSRDQETFQKIWDCLLLYFPDLKCSVTELPGGFTVDINELEATLDAVVLAEVVKCGAHHIRDISVTWVKEPKVCLALTIQVSTSPLNYHQLDVFSPVAYPGLEFRERLNAKQVDVRDAPADFQGVLPFYEDALDCIYSRGANISTPQTDLFFDTQDNTWLRVTNMDQVHYSFLQYLTANSGLDFVLMDPQFQTLFLRTDLGTEVKLSLPARHP